MRAFPVNLVGFIAIGLSFLTSCGPDPKSGDTTKDSDANTSNTPVDLNTDDLTSDDILLISDTTAPVVTVNTQIASYTDTLTPSFEVTSDEDGTLTVGGSCTITGQDSITASTQTSITLDALTDGSTYDDCTVTVTDAATNSGVAILTDFTVSLSGVFISQSGAVDATSGSGSVTSNTTPLLQVDLYSSTGQAVDTASGGSIAFTGGCETAATTISDTATTDLTLTGSGGAAFTDGVYNCTLAVNNGVGASNTLTLDAFTIDSTAPTITVTDTSGTVTTSISFADNTGIGTTVATVSGSDTNTSSSAITYSESGSGDAVANAAFDISSLGVVSLMAGTLTHGTTYSYTVVVADDALPTSNQGTETITFTVTETNAAPVLNSSNVSNFSAISEHITNGANTGQAVSTLLTNGSPAITDTNSGTPSQGIAIYETTAAGSSEWQYKDATGNWTAIPIVGSTSFFLLTPADELRYVPSVTNGESGTLSFYAWDQTDGSQYATETVLTQGGTTAYSADAATVSIVVSDANDPPTMTPSTTTNISPINEGAISTITLNTELSSLISDVDTASGFADLGIAVTGFTETDAGSWEYSTNSGGTWSDFSGLASLSETSAFLMDASNTQGRIRFVSSSSNGETATIEFYAWDQSASDSPGDIVDLTAVYGNVDSPYSASGSANTFSLLVNDLNDAPVLASGVANFTDIEEDDTNTSGDLVSDLLNGQLSDVDTTYSEGVAIYSVAAGNGTWQYASGADPNTWVGFPSGIDTTNALLLASTYSIRFVPSNDNADSASITYYGWDQSSSASTDLVDASTVGGQTPYSVASGTSTIAVSDINDQPVLDTSTTPITLTPINEGDTGSIVYSASVLISSQSGLTITDSDPADSKGIAITDASESNGQWEYSSDGVNNWTPITGVTTSSALLLDEAYSLRFASTGPDGVTATLTFLAWDQTSGSSEGTADTTATFTPSTISPFSSDSNSLSLVVTDLNDAPELAGVTTSLGTITENDGDSSADNVTTYDLSTLLSGLITDTDTTSAFNSLGIAVTGVSTTNGRWDYATAGSSGPWTEITGVSSTSVLVLDDSAYIRFIPDSTNGTTATLTFLAWDQSDSESNGSIVAISGSNQGDAGAYSLAEDTFSLVITDKNDRPVFADSTDVALTPTISEGDTSIAYNLHTILDPSTTITDADDASLATIGVAVTSASTTEGGWEYSTNNGGSWTAFADSTPSTSAALLFDISSSSVAPNIRFNASTGQNAVSASLEVYAWDQTQTPSPADVATQNLTDGVTSTFSSAVRNITLDVSGTNDRPVLDITTSPSPITLTTINEGDSGSIVYSASVLISSDIGSTISDSDSGALKGIAITSASESNGQWEYSSDGVNNWTPISGATTSAAYLLDEAYSLRFASTGPDGVTATLDFLAWDQTSGSSEGTADTTATFTPSTISPFSSDSNSLSLVVTDLNDAPELADGVTINIGTITEDDAPIADEPAYSSLTTFQVSSIVNSSVYTDTDTTSAFNNVGIAVTGVSTTNGRWEYSKDNESTWQTAPAVSSSLVLLLDDTDYVRFVPNGANGITATLDFLGWDQSNSPTIASNNTTSLTSSEQGDAGAYSLYSNEMSLTVDSVNDAPDLDSPTGSTTLTSITENDVENAGQLISDILLDSSGNTRVTDNDDGAVYGVAVYDATSGGGTWEYNLNAGAGWQSVEAGSALSTSNARLIPSDANLRYNPSSAAENGETTDPTISYMVWDQTSGNAGDFSVAVTTGDATAFSVNTEVATITVSSLNDAPVIVSASDLSTITEDDNDSEASAPTSFSQLSSLISVSDVDTSAPDDGIAIVAQTATNGVWKYSLDAVTWGTISISTGALVLELDDYVAFVPNAHNGGTSSLEFRAWDQYSDTAAPSPGTNTTISATGGTAAFSASTSTIEIFVSEVNDAPVWSAGAAGGSFTAITENEITNSGDVVDLLLTNDSDNDSTATRGIAIYNSTLGSNGTGHWEYQIDSSSNWTAVGSVDSSAALLLGDSSYVRFVPDQNNGESVNPYIDFYVWDGSHSFIGTTADVSTRGDTDHTANFSGDSGRSEIVVSDVNDAPVLSAGNLVYDEGELVVQLNATDAVGSNGDISVTEVDIGDSLTVTLTLKQVYWPSDAASPDGTDTRTFVENNQAVVLDYNDTYGGTLSTDSTSWNSSTNELELTGDVTSINAELQTLQFTPTAGLTPTDIASSGVADFDLNTVITIEVDDSTALDSSAPTLTAQTVGADRPIAIVYWDAYEDQAAAESADQSKLVTELTPDSPSDGVFIRVDASMSWDPDNGDDVVSYSFTPDDSIFVDCDGDGAAESLSNTVGCEFTDGTDYIVHQARTADITWTVSVTDNIGQSNDVADLHDQVVVSIANQPPEVTLYLSSDVDVCTQAHANGTNNPVYADEDLDCFCSEADCDTQGVNGAAGNSGNLTCVNSSGASCDPTLSSIAECVSLSAVYVDEMGGTDTACYCEEMDCDGLDSEGEANCYDESGQTCTPITTSINACIPILSPDDFDFPWEVEFGLVACAYDANGDVLSYNWSMSSLPSNQGTANFTDVDNVATISVDHPGTYNNETTFDISIDVSDQEDTVTRTADFNFCAGWFQDLDQDGYGATTDYQASCSSTISSTFSDPLPTNSNVSVVQGNDYSGLDCLDTGTLADDSTLYGTLASVTQLTAAQIQDTVNWYVDYDNDGYGAIVGGRGDNGSGQFQLTDGTGATTDSIDIVYVDATEDCVLTNPSVTLSTNEVKNYLLNTDDCNDILDFSDGVYTESPSTGGLGASNQNPETTWYADIDEDGYAIAGSTDTSANYVYPDEDYDCLCTATQGGSCSTVVNNYQLDLNATSTSCVKTNFLYSYKIQYQQCESPTVDSSTQSIADLPNSWIVNNTTGFGDCDETNASINEGAQEACDESDVDEDCDGQADDNDTNGSVSGALTFFVDGDSDGFPTSVGKEFSCDGSSSTGASSLVYYYRLPDSNTTFTDSSVSGTCICPTDQCNEACRLSDDATQSCAPTNDQSFTSGTSYCAGTLSGSDFNFTTTSFDFTATSYSDFTVYVEDCDDTSGDVYPRATEACDGVLNDCVNQADGVPTDEIDYDNDQYVECEFDGSSWNGANAPLVGADCSPLDTNVYPNAADICDGQYNNCASWRDTYVDISRECFCYAVDATDSSLCDTSTCVDTAGASCTPGFDSQNLQTCTLWSGVTERFADEAGSCYCDAATSAGLCDSTTCHTAEGVECTPVDLNNDGLESCTEVEFDNKITPGAPANQTDDDDDCFVECFDGSTSWVGGTAPLGGSCSIIDEGQDCNDTSAAVYPGAAEVCDGQYNNCDSPSFVATGAPVNETDDDGDGYVECDDDGSTWVVGTTGYGDCADLDDTRYPGAPEICDGLFNSCDHPLLDDFVGASGEDCYCSNSDGSGGCVDSSNVACSVDTNVVDLVQLSNAVLIGAATRLYQEVECYCPTSDCQIDVDGDGLTDCLDENEDPCSPTDSGNDGLADSCVTDPIDISTGSALSQSYYSLTDASLTNAPGRETDNDSDNYVECNYTASIWVGDPYVIGGDDCEDFPTNNGDRIYPGATEHCDGVYNDCSDATYSSTTPPTLESDVDGDGYVECTLTAGFAWAIAETDPETIYTDGEGCFCNGPCDDVSSVCTDSDGVTCTPDSSACYVGGYGDCDDTNQLVYPGAFEACDGVFNNCSDSEYSASGAPTLESDVDGDGYVECSENADYPWIGSVAPTGYEDCDDDVATIYPDASEVCDGRFNDCDHPLNPESDIAGLYSGAVGDCFCPVIDTTGDGAVDSCDASGCEDASGNSCTPTNTSTDGNGNTLVDNCVIADATTSAFVTTLAGTDLFGAEVDCYCPTTDCQLDLTGDAVNDCYAPDGSECQALSDNSGFAEACLTNLSSTTVTVSHQFVDTSNDPVDQPWDEMDNDNDGYVECDQFDLSTYRSGGGSFNVVGGLDCDDYDQFVYPTATEYCDGQFNDCDDVTYDATSAPDDETDDDGDTFVECVDTTNGSVPWVGDTTVLLYVDATGCFCSGPCDDSTSVCTDSDGVTCTPDVVTCTTTSDCNDSDSTVYPSAEEVCDGQYNDCNDSAYDASGVPDDEADLDGDGYVVCTNPSTWANQDVPTGYGDCDDNDATVFSAAAEICDGLVNACGGVLPDDEADLDGDGYVECEYFEDIWIGTAGDGVVGGSDCNDDDVLVFPGATEYCDGQFNDCGDLAYDATSAPDDETDNDGDAFVECALTTGVPWVGDTTILLYTDAAGCSCNGPCDDGTSVCTDSDGVTCTPDVVTCTTTADCDDTDVSVFPYAPDLCDGQYNNCEDVNFDLVNVPDDEADLDSDGHVECADDGSTWSDSDTLPSGYEDCDDGNSAKYLGATEECDGIFNDCEHPQLSAFEGLVGDCLCPLNSTQDACLSTSCSDIFGNTCTPNDVDDNGYVVNCGISTTPITINGIDYYGAEIECYCPETDCQLDELGNGASDCLTPAGDTCVPTELIQPGFADDCLTIDPHPRNAVVPSPVHTGTLTIQHTFEASSGVSLTRPLNETDNDGDGFVECEYVSASWLGSLSIVGGLDCDDFDDAVYPSAEEVCDGQYNDCSNNYVETSAPEDETDDDGDGWIECTRDMDVVWNAYDGSSEPNIMGYGTDGITNGVSYCMCSDEDCLNNCTDEDGNTCTLSNDDICLSYITYEYSDCDDADEYTHPYVALSEYDDAGDGVGPFSCVRDRDGDGFGDSAPTVAGVTAGHDCDDLNIYVRPKQNETCEVDEQIDSDCNGDVNTADYSEGYILDTNGVGSLLYVDSDGDGFGDSSIAATSACEVADGFVFNATDCDDADSTINPNSKEICDGIDQDCDLTIDEPDSLDDPSISKCTYMYRDVDADSYGDVDYTECLCQEGSDPSVTYGEYEYVIYSGDCYDFNADIKPLTCADGIDQDDDGLVDDEDDNCIAGYEEGSDTVKEEAFELLDGHDNNCDGLVAAVELDCDDDGSFALVPGESASFDRSDTFQMAADIGLEACSGVSTTLDCWGEQQRLVCDTLTAELSNGGIEYNGTGLWMLNISESDDGFAGRFDGGHREYPSGRVCGYSFGDCDDQCADRCPDQIETCDGVDNDCSSTSPGTDGETGDEFEGIPDSMIAENPIAGTISETEIDIDSDGYLSCANFTFSGTQNQWSDASCDTISGVSDENDCNNYCFFSSPNAEERCDAFQGLCDGENLDGTDADGDDMLTCGAWGTDETLTEDIYVVVWMKDVDWSQLASEEQELIRPIRTPEDIAWALAQRDTADTAFDNGNDTGDTGWVDSQSAQETDPQRLLRERRQFINERLPIMNTNGGLIAGDIEPDLLERMIPLISPRDLAPYCDSYLQDQLTLLLGVDNMEVLRQSDSAEEQADILLQACDTDIDGVGGCGIVRLSLSKTTDDETYDYLDAIQTEILSFPTECEERTEEWISRSMWQRDRIVDARTITVEWECRRMYGQACSEISTATRLLDGWETSMSSPERWLDADREWFKEIGRYNPEAISNGTMMSCWGDPTDPTANFNQEVGGDCADADSEAHRDKPEGPGDLVGLYLYGDMADCDTCLDGIDNNCDGAIDCADPACAPCFVGQGVGCGGGKDSPCSQGGCASPDQSGKERMYRSLGLIMMAMLISIIRRRETRSTT